MSAPARAGTGGTAAPLPLGTVVGGRFRIQSFVRSESDKFAKIIERAKIKPDG